jgi:DNA-binding XRE family transcriptional regulator
LLFGGRQFDEASNKLGIMVDDKKINFNPDVPTLKQVRERLGMTQEELGQALGISGNTISRYERGVHQRIKFTIAQMKRLQELLEKAGLSIKDLPDDVD